MPKVYVVTDGLRFLCYSSIADDRRTPYVQFAIFYTRLEAAHDAAVYHGMIVAELNVTLLPMPLTA